MPKATSAAPAARPEHDTRHREARVGLARAIIVARRERPKAAFESRIPQGTQRLPQGPRRRGAGRIAR
jgi:hypothetical protein